MAQRRRAMFALLLLLTVPTPACSQCTTCNQQPSQVYYNSQVAVQPANQARPGQFQPPSSVSRNQQIYVWYGQPQPMQNQNGVPQQPQYNPNYNNNNQQPVMYNNINRDQPNYANQPYPNPAVQQQVSPRPVYPTTYYPSTTTQAPFTSTYPSTTTTYYPSTTTMAPMTSTYPTTTMSPYPSTLTPAQQQQQIGYNPAGQPVQQQQQPYYPTSTQAPFVSSTPSTPYAQSTTPYGSPYPMTGTPVNQGAIGVNNVQGTTPYYPSTTPAPTQPFYNPTTTQQPFNQGLQGVTGSPVYQIGQGVPGNTPQYNPPGSMSSTYSPYAASGSTLGNQVLYDPSTGLSTANGMNTMYGKYTTMEPGSQMMRDVPIANGGAALSLLTGIAALVFLF